MPKNNLKNQPRKKIPSPKPLQKRQVSFGVLSLEKNPCLAGRQAKSETLVIAREQSDRSNLRDSSGLLRFARNDKGASGNDKGVALSLRGVQNQLYDEAISGITTLPLVARNDKSVGAWNFKSWHKISAPE